MQSTGGSLLPASGNPDSFGRNAPPNVLRTRATMFYFCPKGAKQGAF